MIIPLPQQTDLIALTFAHQEQENKLTVVSKASLDPKSAASFPKTAMSGKSTLTVVLVVSQKLAYDAFELKNGAFVWYFMSHRQDLGVAECCWQLL